MARVLRRFTACTKGAVAVEYVIIAAAMFLALIPSFLYVAAAMGVKFATVTSFFNGF